MEAKFQAMLAIYRLTCSRCRQIAGHTYELHATPTKMSRIPTNCTCIDCKEIYGDIQAMLAKCRQFAGNDDELQVVEVAKSE